ncbi:choice-of-anchor J domain-containing protein, partial [Arthrospira platensis SPKY1]|nr:choice-of-anchor J domain-containing protein [Arthrospira platensis SPKY1]
MSALSNSPNDNRNSSYIEDFEGEVFPPANWTVYSFLDVSENWSLSLWQNHTPGGTQSAFHNSTSGDLPVDNWLVSPQLSIASDGFHYLSIWSYLANSWSYKSNTVLISTGSPDPADNDYIVVWDNASDLGNAWLWMNYFVNLENYIGQDIYVAFRYE